MVVLELERTTGAAIEDISQNKLTPGGLKDTLHGNLYQWSLLTWFTLHLDSSRRFQLITEAEEFEKFDDLVLKYDDEILFLQAKHSSKEDGTDDYKKSNFTSDNYNGEASLAKYFDSWYRLEKSEVKKKNYVFFTNRGIVDYSCFLEHFTIDIPQLNFKKGETLKFKRGNSRIEFINAIRAYSEEVKSFKDNTELDIKPQEIEEARKYLEKKFKKYESTKKFKISLSTLNNLELYTIKLAQEDDTELNNISMDNSLKTWLRAKDKSGAYKITFSKAVSCPIKNSISNKKHYEKISSYLESKFKKYKEYTLKVDGSAKISKKAQAVIKLAQEKDFVFNLISNDHSLKSWLRSKNLNGKKMVKIGMLNATELLSSVMEKEINEFLDQLILKVRQPNFWEMSKKIHEKSVTPIAAVEVCANIELQVLRWFANPRDCDLSSEKISKMILSAKGDALRFYLLASTDKQHSLSGTSLKEIADFFKSNNVIIILKKFKGIDLRIAQTIKEYGYSKDQYAFLNAASPHLEYVSTVLHGEQMQVVVFDFSNYERSQLEKLENLITIAITNKKKVIILCNTNDENFKKYGQQIDVISKLSDEQIQRAVKGKEDANIIIAGKNYKLEKFLADKTSGVYKAMKYPSFLYEILYQDNENKLSSGLLHNIYIPNELLKGEPIFNWRNLLSTVQTRLFVLKGRNAEEVHSAARNGEGDFKDRTLFEHEQAKEDSKYRVVGKEELSLVSETESHIRQICIDATITPESIPYNNYVFLNVIEKGKATIETSKGALLPIADSYKFNNKAVITRDDIIAQNFCVISAKAGYGKSSFCLDQRMQWLNLEQSHYSWVIRLDLSCLEFKSEKASETELFNEKTSSVYWSSWQLKALKYDMQHPGRVRILLDGFDEIKDLKVIKKFGDWIGNVPKEVSLVITTRPYAAHNIPMPANRSLDLFLALQEYNEFDRKEYIKAYISAKVKNPIHEHLKNVVILYQEFAISNLNVKSLIGVPLEMYLFCEIFELEILERYEELKKGKKNSEKIKGFQLGAVSLIEKFMIKKLSIFLTKHLRIENQPRSLKDEHLAYVTSSLYIDVLQAFAFKQAFDLNYEVVIRALRDRYYDDNIIQELKETGLVLVERKHNELFLKFNHVTYQEYFSALKLISGLCSGDFDVQQIFRQCKQYMPSYQVIFEFAGELGLNRSKPLLRLNQDPFLGAKKFWRALFGETSVGRDLLGAAESALTQRCLSVLSDDNRATLKKLSLDNSSSIKSSISKDFDFFNRKKKQAAPVEHPIEEQIKECCDDPSNLKNIYTNNFIKEKEIKDQIKEFCDDKTKLKELKEYIKGFSKESEGMVRKSLSNELIARVEWDQRYSYWAIDFGISAVALCGEYFSKDLADKLKCRADMWENNLTLALRVWDKVVGTVWRGHTEEIANVISYGLSQLLQSKYSNSFFKEKLPNLRKVVGAFLEYLKSNFDYGKSIIEILQIALKLNYAVVVNNDDTVLQLIGDEEYSISINHLFFFETLKVLKGEQCNDSTEYIDSIQSNPKLKELDSKYKLESLTKLDSLEIKNYFKNLFYELSKEKDIEGLREVFKNLYDIQFPNINLARKTLAENFFAARHESNSYWEYDFGALAILYCGRFVPKNIESLYTTRGFNATERIRDSCSLLVDELIDESKVVVQSSEEFAETLQALQIIEKTISNNEITSKIQEAKLYLGRIRMYFSKFHSLEEAKLFFKFETLCSKKSDKKRTASSAETNECNKISRKRKYDDDNSSTFDSSEIGNSV